MKNIILFNEDEKGIIRRLIKLLQSLGRKAEVRSLKNNRTALKELAASISLYPSILRTHQLGGISRSVDTLITMLCQNEEPDVILHIPTKALLGQGYTIAKINFFFMLLYLTRDISKGNSIENDIRATISNNVFTLMAEEVFLSIIKDSEISDQIRSNAGYLLAKIWEYRLDHGVKEFAPLLSNIWRARGEIEPVFGTLLCLSEIYRITENTDGEWLDFLQRDGLTEEEVFSLEEFLFDLSYEEIMRVRQEMERRGDSSISVKDVEEIIGRKGVYLEYESDDPRALYRSFKLREINAKYRARSKASGPKKTIEEYIMCYLLSKQEEVNFNKDY
jgi:hypothetical protein